MNIIAVDRGKDARKRSAYRAELSARKIFRLPFNRLRGQVVDL
jgi:hypothetical protein